MLLWYYQIYCLAPPVDHEGGGNCVCPPSVEVFSSQWYQKAHSVPVLRKLISALGVIFPLEHYLERTVHCSISLWDSEHIEGCPSVWSKSTATLNVLLPLLSLPCLSFEIEVLVVLEYFCLLVFLQNLFLTGGFYSMWMCVLFQMLLKSRYNEIEFNEMKGFVVL